MYTYLVLPQTVSIDFVTLCCQSLAIKACICPVVQQSEPNGTRAYFVVYANFNILKSLEVLPINHYHFKLLIVKCFFLL